MLTIVLDVNFCKDHRDKTDWVPEPLAVEDLISYKLNNRLTAVSLFVNVDFSKDRFNEHRRPVDKRSNSSKLTTLSEHFLCNSHNNATDMQLTPLELVKSNRDSARKAREAYLIERGPTLEPHGLNKKDKT